jgi:hypothetical protein
MYVYFSPIFEIYCTYKGVLCDNSNLRIDLRRYLSSFLIITKMGHLDANLRGQLDLLML